VAQVRDLFRRRGALRHGGHPVQGPAAHQKGAEPAAEAVRPVQPGHRDHQQLLRHRLGRRQYREDQHGPGRLPEQVRDV